MHGTDTSTLTAHDARCRMASEDQSYGEWIAENATDEDGNYDADKFEEAYAEQYLNDGDSEQSDASDGDAGDASDGGESADEDVSDDDDE